MNISGWFEILALVTQFMLIVDITRSFDKMQYAETLWLQKLRKYWENILIQSSFFLDYIAGFAARTQLLAITYSNVLAFLLFYKQS